MILTQDTTFIPYESINAEFVDAQLVHVWHEGVNTYKLK